MSQTKTHKITVRSKAPGQISTGFNTEILIDGVPVKGVTFAKFEFKPNKIAKIVLELVGEVEIDGVFEDVVAK